MTKTQVKAVQINSYQRKVLKDDRLKQVMAVSAGDEQGGCWEM